MVSRHPARAAVAVIAVLAVAVLVDATVVRLVLVPAIMELLGRGADRGRWPRPIDGISLWRQTNWSHL